MKYLFCILKCHELSNKELYRFVSVNDVKQNVFPRLYAPNKCSKLRRFASVNEVKKMFSPVQNSQKKGSVVARQVDYILHGKCHQTSRSEGWASPYTSLNTQIYAHTRKCTPKLTHSLTQEAQYLLFSTKHGSL